MGKRFLGSVPGGNRRGRSPVEYRGNLYVRPYVRTSVCPSVPPKATKRLAQASQRLTQASQRLTQASQRLAQASQRLAQASQRLAQASQGQAQVSQSQAQASQSSAQASQSWACELRRKDGRADGWAGGRTYRFPWYSTGLRPL